MTPNAVVYSYSVDQTSFQMYTHLLRKFRVCSILGASHTYTHQSTTTWRWTDSSAHPLLTYALASLPRNQALCARLWSPMLCLPPPSPPSIDSIGSMCQLGGCPGRCSRVWTMARKDALFKNRESRSNHPKPQTIEMADFEWHAAWLCWWIT
jgi:hypothetical protein